MTTHTESRKTGDMILFAQVVEAGTITGGSKLMGLERSTVSRRITSLEDRLGVSLLERSTRKLRLTEVGRQYYQHCLRVVEAAEDAEAAAQGFRVAPSGVLNIAASMAEADRFLSNLIADFIESNEQIHVELSLDTTSEALLDQKADLLLHAGKPGDLGTTGTRIGQIREYLWASPRYLKRIPITGSPDSLKQAATISLTQEPESIRWQLRSPRERIDLTVFPRFRVRNLTGCRDSCVSGLGVAKLPEYLCLDYEQRGELVRLYPNWRIGGSALYAVHGRNQYLTRKAKAFIEFMSERLADH